MTRRKYTNEDIKLAVENSFSWADVCRKLGITPATGSQTHLTKRAKEINIDASHFIGTHWNKGKKFGNKKPIEEYLQITSSAINGGWLKRRLIRENLKENKCEQCLITEWFGETDFLELDHINSNHFDNRLENLQILCPNCHAIKTKLCRNTAVAQRQEATALETVQCEFESRSQYQKIGRKHLRKVEWPSKEELEILLWEKPTSTIALDFKVSGSAISKWAKHYGLTKPPRGYWMKLKSKELVP